MTTNRIDPTRARRIAAFAALLAVTGLAAHAASQRPQPTAAALLPKASPPRIEVVFVLDTTGSMSGLIEGAKRKIWSIANQMASAQPTPEIRMGLVAYRDRGDDYVTSRHDLSADIDAFYAKLQGYQAGGGGDGPESVNQALHEAVQHLSWTPGQEVYKVVFLVGDAPPHMDYQDDVPYAKSVSLARRHGIVVNTVQCGEWQETTGVWQEIASTGAGRFVAIRQDGGMLALATPHDDELARLNRELAGTAVAYGAEAERAEIEAKVSAATAAPAPTAAARLSFLSKLGGKLNSGRADLVDAVKDKLVDLKSLDEDALPEPMRAMAPAEREAFVQKKLDEREKLQTQIAEVSKERDRYVADEEKRRAAAGLGDGFDQQVMGAIREQAAAKGIVY
jgi:Mg-chelatase subunit ChlD